MVLLLPIVAILALLSSHTGFSIHSRYAIPVLPFAYIWCSKVARSIAAGHKVFAIIAALALCWSVGSSLAVYPHSLSYFNELVGGPMGGHHHLVDSNIAWGQDLYYLKQWYDEHPEARPLHLAYYNLFDPRLAGIEFNVPPVGSVSPDSHAAATADRNLPPGELGPLPGWYAIDANHLQGAKYRTANGKGGWARVSWDGYDLTYFQRFKPIATAGYSIYIYHVTPEEANQARKELGLNEWPTDSKTFPHEHANPELLPDK